MLRGLGVVVFGMSVIDWSGMVPNGGRVFLGGGASVPHFLIRDLLSMKDAFQDVELIHIHTLGEMPWVAEEYEGHFRPNSFFLSRDMCGAVDEGRADYTPCPMSEIPRLFRTKVLPLDVAIIQVGPPDGDGMVSLGLSADVVCSAVKSANKVVAQVNKRMPRTYGDTLIPASSVDVFVEHDGDIREIVPWEYKDHHEKIAEYAAQLVEDGSTIQASMGNSPQAVLRALRGHRDLGIHTGCFTDGMMDLVRSGAVTNMKKGSQKGVSVASHCLGSAELYDFVRDNEEIELRRSEWANDPHRIGKLKRMVAINGAREIDLTGQVVRDSRGHRFYGGIGATQDFIRGAGMSAGGRPIIALASMDGDGTSRIVTGLTSGSGVCSSRGDVHYVVTEYGVANLVGQTIRQRVLRLVEIAHPSAREGLLEGARMQGWIPKMYGFNPKGLHDSDEKIDRKRVRFKNLDYVLRPLNPSDVRSLQRFLFAQDEETIRLRYGYAKPAMDEGTAYRMASVDQSSDLALGVFHRVGHREELRAVGRFYLDDGGESAEVAFLVHEKARRRGIANYLLSEMAEIAEERGVGKFWATVLPGNKPMAQLFLNREAKRKRAMDEDGDEYIMGVKELVEQAKVWRARKKKGEAEPKKEVKRKRRKKVDVGVYHSKAMLDHHTGAGHVESVARYVAVRGVLKGMEGIVRIRERSAEVSEVVAVHSPSYHDMARYDIENFADHLRTGDTAVCEDSYRVAMLATGSVLSAVDAVMGGEVGRAFCAVRPPGHHATADRGMGFCIFNHVAVAARYLQKEHGVERVAILDWDVHHGNGTQEIFYEDGSVFYFSTHESGIFPYSGDRGECGDGDGLGATLNVPLAAGEGDDALIEAWGDEVLGKALREFKPDFILVSAGFDAALGDPLGDLKVSVGGFGKLTELVCGYADELCEGRVVSCMEGGYEPGMLAECVERHVGLLKRVQKVT